MRAILKIFGRLARPRVQQACVQMVVSVVVGTHHTRCEFASEAANSFPNSTLATVIRDEVLSSPQAVPHEENTSLQTRALSDASPWAKREQLNAEVSPIGSLAQKLSPYKRATAKQ